MELEVNSEGMKIETEKSIDSIHLLCFVRFYLKYVTERTTVECSHAFEMAYDDSLFTVPITNTSIDLFMLYQSHYKVDRHEWLQVKHNVLCCTSALLLWLQRLTYPFIWRAWPLCLYWITSKLHLVILEINKLFNYLPYDVSVCVGLRVSGVHALAL